ARLSLGTIYLHEPGALPRDVQTRLAQFLTHRADASEAVPRLIVGRVRSQDGQLLPLLEELVCRVSTLTIDVPPLRERRHELDRLCDLFLLRATVALEQEQPGLSPEASQALTAYPWPGNLRELSDVLVGALRHAVGRRIEVSDLSFYLRHGPLPPERKL